MGITREQLYEEVWVEPMTKVAERHGVSSNFLARVCDRLNVPRPERGYWARKSSGRSSYRPPLPEAQYGDEIEWVPGDGWLRCRVAPKPPAEGTGRSHRRRRKRPAQHYLLANVRTHFESAKESDTGYLCPERKNLVDLFVTRGTLDRALGIANELFLSLEDYGYEVVLPRNRNLGRQSVREREDPNVYDLRSDAWQPDRPTVVFVGAVAIGLTLFELSEKVDVRQIDGKYERVTEPSVPSRTHRRYRPLLPMLERREMPSGKLCLRASSPYWMAKWEKKWTEVRGKELLKIADIARELESAAITISAAVEAAERKFDNERRELQAEIERLEREEIERRRARKIKESRDELFAIIEDWGVAKRIENFFEDAEHRATALEGSERDAVRDRLRYARELLGGVDALARFRKWKAPDER